MQWFNDLKISSKLLFGFSFVVLLVVALGTFSIWQLKQVNDKSTEIADNWLPSVIRVSDMNTNTSDFRIAELQHVSSLTQEEMSGYEKNMKEVENKFNENDQAYDKLISSDKERDIYKVFKSKWESYLVEHDKILELSRQNKNDEAKALLRGKSQTLFDEASAKLIELVELNKKGGVDASAEGDVLYYYARILVIAALLATIILSILIALFISSVIAKPIIEAVETAEKLSHGELPTEMKINSRDEIGRLVEAMNNMTGYLREMATTASTIAEGDLSKNVEPKSSRDVFGNAFKRMLESLRSMAGVAEKIAGGDLNVNVRPQSAQDAFGNAFKGMVDNLRTMASVADSIAKGNLTVQVQPQSAADVFGNTFKMMLDSLRTIIRELRENAQTLSSSAEELVAVSTNQSAVITEQASSIQEISTTLDEIRATVEQASDKAKSVAHVSEQSLEISKAGQQELEQVVGAMSKIKDQVETIAENILDLSEKTIQIGEITSSVNDIAEQSN
ncbi:MAG: MCP four helix bundle domain-containing protein, partial [Acidobacteria bacterium]|nr:MCP four helix bundle domain-containing protein [Acidobacteriota bacterium]